ncbi:MAG TPA: cytochrome c, partial [Beijerinckiaceae bacterium]|nr:cytochrome c [Beijerinckiaceae bacterium]
MGTPGRSSTTAHAYLLPSWNGQHTILTLPHRSAHEHPHVADLGRRIPLWKPPVRRGHQVGRLRSDDNCLVLSPLAAHAAQRWGVWALFGDLSSNRRQPVVVFCLCRPSKRQASLATDHPARVGQAVFEATCLACHRMNGGGSSEMGPDLNRPMNPTEY